jgi:hypothetical protein
VSELTADANSQSRGPIMSLLLVIVAIPTFAAHFAKHICDCIDAVIGEKCELRKLLTNVFEFLDVGIANRLLESHWKSLLR